MLNAGVRNCGIGELCGIPIHQRRILALRCEQGVMGSLHVLWLRCGGTTGPLFSSQVLGCYFRPYTALVPLWLLAFRLHSCLGELSESNHTFYCIFVCLIFPHMFRVELRGRGGAKKVFVSCVFSVSLCCSMGCYEVGSGGRSSSYISWFPGYQHQDAHQDSK